MNSNHYLSDGLPKADQKFILDMLYGLARNQSVLLTDISRALLEDTKLSNTVDRLSSHLMETDDSVTDTIKSRYYKKVLKYLDDDVLVNLDDSEIVKEYGKKFEDLDLVRDASSKDDRIVPGYHVCEASVVTKKQRQPISLYSKVYSTKSDGFKSTNEETIKSIKAVQNILNKSCTFVMDRGYDANIFYKFFLNENEGKDDFIIRLKKNRNLLFKGKSKNAGEIAKKRKGKIKMDIWFKETDKKCYVSHTRVKLPSIPDKVLTLVIVYGLSDEEPMMLLTNKIVKNKRDVLKIVRAYINRWRIEENFRFKKQQYKFENIRVRSLKSINVMNTLLMIHIGHIGMMAEKVDKKLLVIKIIERSQSLNNESYLWFYKIANGIKNILGYAHNGVREFENIKTKQPYLQLSLDL